MRYCQDIHIFFQSNKKTKTTDILEIPFFLIEKKAKYSTQIGSKKKSCFLWLFGQKLSFLCCLLCNKQSKLVDFTLLIVFYFIKSLKYSIKKNVYSQTKCLFPFMKYQVKSFKIMACIFILNILLFLC